ncbi:MAG: hypothetical protein H6733_06830 [Alphaproteobacteria bacterium]|nr:hypothetical protein [Alphaproteobacteria bacterium]
MTTDPQILMQAFAASVQRAALLWSAGGFLVGLVLGAVATLALASTRLLRRDDGSLQPVVTALAGVWIVGTWALVGGSAAGALGGMRAALDGMAELAQDHPELAMVRDRAPTVVAVVLSVGDQLAGETAPEGGVVDAMTQRGWEMPVPRARAAVRALAAAVRADPHGDAVDALGDAMADAFGPDGGQVARGVAQAFGDPKQELPVAFDAEMASALAEVAGQHGDTDAVGTADLDALLTTMLGNVARRVWWLWFLVVTLGTGAALAGFLGVAAIFALAARTFVTPRGAQPSAHVVVEGDGSLG